MVHQGFPSGLSYGPVAATKILEFTEPGIYDFDYYELIPKYDSSVGLYYIELPDWFNFTATYIVASADSYMIVEPLEKVAREGEGVGTSTYNDYFEANDCIDPKITPTVLINWLAFRYGLVFTSDSRNKTVYINRIKDIINSRYSAVDWSEKIDFKIKPESTFRINNFAQNNLYEDADGNVQATRVINNEQLIREKTVYASPFSDFEYVDTFQSTLRLPFINMWPDPAGDPVQTSPIVARAQLSDEQLVVVPLQDTQPDYETAATVNQLGLTIDEILIDSWTEFFNVLQTVRIEECYLRLTDADIHNLDFTKPVYIDSLKGYYLVQEVSGYQFNKINTVKTKLFRI